MSPFEARGARPFTLTGSSFSRSYGGILPSSLTTVLPIALVFSTCPPVSVWVRAACELARGFSRQHGISHFVWIDSASRLRLCEVRICLDLALHAYPRTTIAWDDLPSCVPSLLASSSWVGSSEDSPLATTNQHGRAHAGTGISTGCASTTPCGLALAPDSPWAD